MSAETAAPPTTGWRASGAEQPRRHSRTRRLPASGISLRVLRHGLRVFLEETDLTDGDLDDLVLAASEAASNAIEHAQASSEAFFDVLDPNRRAVRIGRHATSLYRRLRRFGPGAPPLRAVQWAAIAVVPLLRSRTSAVVSA